MLEIVKRLDTAKSFVFCPADGGRAYIPIARQTRASSNGLRASIKSSTAWATIASIRNSPDVSQSIQIFKISETDS